jgi:Cdc6-like AAA superfamily ATPase
LPKRPIKEHQELAINQIMDIYNKETYCVCLLYGEPGTMKSMTAQYLCKSILETHNEVCFVDSFNPFEQGDYFSSLYNTVNPSIDKPLVIILEEIDCNISKMHLGLIQVNKYIPTQIKTKTDWNSFLDKFDRCLYPNVIIIMTTNKSINYFDDLDPSYFRQGRVNLKIKF